MGKQYLTGMRISEWPHTYQKGVDELRLDWNNDRHHAIKIPTHATVQELVKILRGAIAMLTEESETR